MKENIFINHPSPTSVNKNIMHQTKQPAAGLKFEEAQILKIEKEYKAGQLNK